MLIGHKRMLLLFDWGLAPSRPPLGYANAFLPIALSVFSDKF